MNCPTDAINDFLGVRKASKIKLYYALKPSQNKILPQHVC